MGIKRVVDTDFWGDDKIVDMFSPEDKLFMLYLLTNPHTTQLGIYALNKKVMAFELGYSLDTISVLLDRFETKYNIIRYSAETQEVAIRNYLRHSIIKGGKPVEDLLMKEISNVKNRKLLTYVFEGLSERDDLNETVKKVVTYIKNNENDNDNENEVSYHDTYHDTSKARKKPPTIEEIKAYIEEKGYKVNAQRFYDYYESGNWKTKAGKYMAGNWKQYVVSWNNKELERIKDQPKGYNSDWQTVNETTETQEERDEREAKIRERLLSI